MEKSFKGEIYEYGAERPVDGGKKGGYTQCPCIDAFRMKDGDIEMIFPFHAVHYIYKL